MTHKSEDYKISAVKYYLKIKIILEKPVKYLIVINLHYKDGKKIRNFQKSYKAKQKINIL